MKKWITLSSLLFLLGCSYLETASTDEQRFLESADVYAEVAPYFEEIENLLTQVELEAGLENLINARSLFDELMIMIAEREVTVNQQARIHTMRELLADVRVDEETTPTEGRPFSGSDAAAKVMNMIGFTPEGYVFVYHEIPSFIGTEGLGYYVFLVPENHDEMDEMEIRETFFVTDRGEILVLE